jgi:hypothetical protein
MGPLNPSTGFRKARVFGPAAGGKELRAMLMTFQE